MTIKLKISPVLGVNIFTRDASGRPIISSDFTDARVHPVTNVLKPHVGIDLRVPLGTGVLAVDDGVIISANFSETAGNMVVIQHSNYKTRYLHLDRFAREVSQGTTVRAGRLIGYVGSTGLSSGPHLHFEVIDASGTKINPRPLLEGIQYLVIGASTERLYETEIRPYATPSPRQPPATAILNPPNQNLVPISPYILTTDSFHPKVQFELSRRRLASETANVYMPFAKLTALLHVLPNHLKGQTVNTPPSSSDSTDRQIFYAAEIERVSTYCPSLGLSGQREITFDDMYLPRDNRSIIGYATQTVDGSHSRIPLVVEDETFDATNIPPAGITSISMERSVAGPMGVRGGLFRATINIVANSIGQLNGLLKYFLRPATKVVIELGRTSSSELETPPKFFDWKRSLDDIKKDIEEIGLSRGGTKALMDKYVYGNYGNYEMFFGFVADFKLKYDKKNKYNITLTVHSLQQFEVPLKHTGTKSLCIGAGTGDKTKVIGIAEYFSDAENWKRNSLSKLLSAAADPRNRSVPNKNQVLPLLGDGTNNPSTTGHLVHWKFFIDVVLHNYTYGLMSIFNLNNIDENNALEMLRRALPPKYAPNQLSYDDAGQFSRADVDGIVDYQVPYHPSLRSTDPDVMIILNTAAEALQRVQNQNQLAQREFIGTSREGNLFYDKIWRFGAGTEDQKLAWFVEHADGLSSLMNGVWLNVNAIKKAFQNADTLSAALTNLLTAMNNATEGFWNLQLLSDDTTAPGVHIVDMGVSKYNKQKDAPPISDGEPRMLNATQNNREKLKEFEGATPDRPQYIYKFNRKLKATTSGDAGDTSTGSDAIDISIQSGMPNVVMVQAIGGVGGLGQRGTLASIDVEELKALSLFDTYAVCAPQTGSAATSTSTSSTGVTQGNMLISDENKRKFAMDAFNRGLSKVESSVVNAYIKGQQDINKFPIYGGPQIKPPKGVFGRDAAGGNMWAHKLVHNVINEEIKKIQEEYIQQNSRLHELADKFVNSFGKALLLIEWNPTAMLEEMESTVDLTPAKRKQVHPFNSSNLTKTIVEVTTAGIGGIQLWQCFDVDRVPSFLRNGYYQVVKLNHELSPARGWTTKITGRFRFDPRDDT